MKAAFASRSDRSLSGPHRSRFYIQEAGHSVDLLPTNTTAVESATRGSKISTAWIFCRSSRDSEALPHEVLYWRAGSQHAIRYGNWNYHTANPSMKRLYDLSEDEGEKKIF